MSDPRSLREHVARGYRARRTGAAVLLVAGIAAGAAGIARAVPAAAPRWSLVAIAIAAALLVAVRALRRAPGPVTIARHLDRTEPALEESTELLLAEPSGLAIADRLERERAARALAARPPSLRHLPDRTARGMAAAGAAGIAVALVAAGAVARGPARAESDVPREPTDAIEPGPPRVRRVSISVAPPRYTGLPVRRQDEWELDVEAGAHLTWSIELDRPAPGMRLVLSTGDTVPLAERGGTLSGSAIARAPALYQLVWGNEGGEYHRLLVRPDEAPSILVLRPAPRTSIPTGAARRVPVEALARDDHAIGDAALVATVTTGAGEGVRFRELRIPLGPGVRRPDGVRFRRTLDLDSLGMAPGDELYFHALARDTREPRPGEGRSETVFIALADTATAAPAEFGGLALSVLPEYFRSQRQVIIDTERLLADSARLPADIIRERANAIGMDQGLLRLRYGAFTGEEFESAVEPGDAHQHDSEESATLLAPATKATLKGAIAEMWEAELRLRTYRPREALPFERRALELLKSVQQASRSYVQRVGFAPPPLDPGRTRLSGTLDGIRSQQSSETVEAPAGQPAIEAALARARELAGGRPARPADPALLEGAAAEIARQPVAAAETGAQLDAVRAVRAYAVALESGRPCPGCADAAVRALAGRLHRPPRSAAPRAPASPLARRYLELLDAP